MIPEDTLNEDAKNEFIKIKEIEEMVDRENLVYKVNIHIVLKFSNNKNFWQGHL